MQNDKSYCSPLFILGNWRFYGKIEENYNSECRIKMLRMWKQAAEVAKSQKKCYIYMCMSAVCLLPCRLRYNMAKKSDLTFCRDRNGFEAGQSSGEWEKVKRVLIVNGSIKPMLKNAENEAITIRAMRKTDPQVFYETYLSYGWHPQIRTYENYYKEQEAGTRKVFIAEYEGNVAGLCTLVPDAGEGPWAGMGFPEIADLSVFSDYRNAGIGNLLLDAAESEAFKLSDMVYLAVGVHSGYGAAQRIYVKRGYNFDGSGVWYQNKPLEQYAQCVNDDDLLLFMSKEK